MDDDGAILYNCYIGEHDSRYFICIPSLGSGTPYREKRKAISIMQDRISSLIIHNIFICQCDCKKCELYPDFFNNVKNLQERTKYNDWQKGSKNVSAFAFTFDGINFEKIRYIIGNFDVSVILSDNEKKEANSLEFNIDEIAEERKEYHSKTKERDHAKIILAKKRDNWCCIFDGCSNNFLKNDGDKFVEVHHIKFVKQKGSDELHNLVSLCAHHHAMAHFGCDACRNKMKDAFLKYIEHKSKGLDYRPPLPEENT